MWKLLWLIALLAVPCGAPAPTAGWTPALQFEVDQTPPTPDLSQYFEPLPSLGKGLVVAQPCIGISGCGWALQGMRVPFDLVHIYDLKLEYLPVINQHCIDIGMCVEQIALNFGRIKGDILQVPLMQLIHHGRVDLLCTGPPCPPWASQGSRRGVRDKRAQVFFRIIVWAIVLVRCCGLCMLVLENVVGILTEVGGRESACNHFLAILRHFCPEFRFSVHTLKLMEYHGCQHRVRVFIRGIRKCFCAMVPEPLPPFGQRQLRDMLGKFECTDRAALPVTHQANIRTIESRIRFMVRIGKLSAHDILVASIDRADNKVYPQALTVNHLPALTTHNQYLFVMSVGDVCNYVPDHQRQHFRKLRGAERLSSMGFPTSLRLQLLSDTTFASGNAYPVQFMVARLGNKAAC